MNRLRESSIRRITLKQLPNSMIALLGLLIGLLLGAGTLLMLSWAGVGLPGAVASVPKTSETDRQSSTAEASKTPEPEVQHEPGVVHLPKQQWSAAGIEIGSAQRGSMERTETVTGKVTPNEDRIAHIFSLVEGIVHETRVRYGQQVEQGEVLAVIDSREVGQTKLDLVKARQDVQIAKVNQEWALKTYNNTKDLIKALDKNPSVRQISEQFTGRPMGEHREQLISAYAEMKLAGTEYERHKNLYQRKAISEQEFLRVKAEYESKQATFQALMEQIGFTSELAAIQTQLALDQAKVSKRSRQSALMIMGYSPEQIEAMEPLEEGEAVAHYTIEAPFDGTITTKDIVVEERVGPDTKLFELIDLSTVWVQADVYQKDLPLVDNLEGRTIRFRTNAYPNQVFKAEVFYSGEIIDPKTRRLQLMAQAENPDHLLKPGQFVTIGLPAGTEPNELKVPASAVLKDGDRNYVFVHLGGERFRRQRVEVGREVPGQTVEIVDGLKAGVPVAVGGTFALKTALRGLGEDGHAH